MSSTWLNVRLFSRHLTIGDPHPWSVRIRFNPYHRENNWPDGAFSWYAPRRAKRG